jgi:hypothetical protein
MGWWVRYKPIWVEQKCMVQMLYVDMNFVLIPYTHKDTIGHTATAVLAIVEVVFAAQLQLLELSLSSWQATASAVFTAQLLSTLSSPCSCCSRHFRRTHLRCMAITDFVFAMWPSWPSSSSSSQYGHRHLCCAAIITQLLSSSLSSS